MTRKLRALVGVIDQAAGRPAVREGHLQRVDHELLAHLVSDAPADDPAAVEVLDGDEVQPPFPRAQVGDVSRPNSGSARWR